MPNEDLIAIASSGEADGYHRSAIEAATAELEKRAPEQSVIAQIEQQVVEDREYEAAKATAPLSNAGWVACVIFGIAIFWTVIAAWMFHHRGYHLKAKQMLWAIPMSYALWWASFALLTYFFT